MASDMCVVLIVNDYSLLAMLFLEGDSHLTCIVEWLTVQILPRAEVPGDTLSENILVHVTYTLIVLTYTLHG